MPFKIDVQCPIKGCDHIVHNTGALGTHLRSVHGIIDKEYRQRVISEARDRALNGEDPLEIEFSKIPREYIDFNIIKQYIRNTRYASRSLDWLRDVDDPEIQSMISKRMNRVSETSNRYDVLHDDAVQTSPRVLAMVDGIDVERDYYEDELDEVGDMTLVRRRIKALQRPISITLPAEVLILYDWVRSQVRREGKDITLSEFIRQCVVGFFKDRGIGIAVVVTHE